MAQYDDYFDTTTTKGSDIIYLYIYIYISLFSSIQLYMLPI